MGEAAEGSAPVDRTADHRGEQADGRAVRVSYETRGFGVALVVDEAGDGTTDETDDAETGVLRVSDAVVTLEIPLADGGRSVLSWDPAEVSVDPQVA